jgi:hypothetical protein
MVRPTKERGVVPFRVNAIFGWDPGEVGAIVDTTPPVDRVVDAVAEMPVEVLTELVQEAIGTRSTGAGTPTAVLGGAPTEGNTLIAIVGQRGSATTTGALSGFTKIGQAATDSFDGGVVAVYYREVAAPGETDTYAYTASSSANIYVAEFSGVGAFVDDATANAVAASASLAASGSVGTGDLLAFAAFAHAVRDNTGAGGVAPDYGWPVGWAREVNAGIDPSGPSVTMAWQQLTGHTPPLAVSGITATNSGTYGWLLATFEVTDRTWQQAPETQDDNDATYRAFDVSGAFWRTMLTEAFAVGTARAFIGFDTAGSRTVTLEGSEDGTFDDAVTLASATITATGSYTGDELAFTVATPGAYQFYRLVAAGAYDGRVYTVELYDYNPATGSADAHIADPTDAHDASAVSYDNGASGLTADDVQEAIDELAAAGPGGGLPWFVVTDPVYGAVGDGTNDDTAEINLAIAALNSAGSGVLYFPAGSYKVTSALTTITVPCLVFGDGGGRTDPASYIFQTSASADLFTFSSEGVTVRDLFLENTSAGATTSKAVVSSAGGWMFIRDCGIILFQDGIDLEGATYYHVQGCYISNLRYGVRIRNTALPDNGDGSVIDNIIIPNASGSGFRLESAGGLRFIGNKVNANGAATSVGVDISIGSITTASLIISGNSIENCMLHGVRFAATGTGSWVGWVISNNQFGLYSNTAGNGININSNTADAIYDGVISGNVFHCTSNANAAVSITKGKNILLAGNVNDGFASMLSQTSCTNVSELSAGSSLTIEDEGTPLATAATTLDFVGSGVVASGTTGDKTITISGVPTGSAGGDLSGTYPNPSVVDDSHSHTSATAPGGSSAYLVISDTPSTPLVFADLVQNEAQDDLVYSD